MCVYRNTHCAHQSHALILVQTKRTPSCACSIPHSYVMYEMEYNYVMYRQSKYKVLAISYLLGTLPGMYLATCMHHLTKLA